MTLSIATWNLHLKNLGSESGIKELVRLETDVICLQEVPGWLKRKLRWTKREYGYKCYFARDLTESGTVCHLAILVRRDIKVLRHKKRVRGTHGPSTTWLARKKKLMEHEESLSVVIRKGRGPRVRIVNFHLPLHVSVTVRHMELEHVFESHYSGIPTFLVGDFNTYAHPLLHLTTLAIVGLAYGCGFFELRIDELAQIEEFSRKRKLQLACKKVVTHPYWILPHLPIARLLRLAGGHLDHILVPRRFRILKSSVFDQRSGSDHSKVVVTISISGSAGP